MRSKTSYHKTGNYRTINVSILESYWISYPLTKLLLIHPHIKHYVESCLPPPPPEILEIFQILSPRMLLGEDTLINLLNLIQVISKDARTRASIRLTSVFNLKPFLFSVFIVDFEPILPAGIIFVRIN